MTSGHTSGLLVAVVASFVAVFVTGAALQLVAGDLYGSGLLLAAAPPMALGGAAGGAAGARAALVGGVRGRDAFVVAVGGTLLMVVALGLLLGAGTVAGAVLPPLWIVAGAVLGARTVVSRAA